MLDDEEMTGEDLERHKALLARLQMGGEGEERERKRLRLMERSETRSEGEFNVSRGKSYYFQFFRSYLLFWPALVDPVGDGRLSLNDLMSPVEDSKDFATLRKELARMEQVYEARKLNVQAPKVARDRELREVQVRLR